MNRAESLLRLTKGVSKPSQQLDVWASTINAGEMNLRAAVFDYRPACRSPLVKPRDVLFIAHRIDQPRGSGLPFLRRFTLCPVV